MNKPTNMPLPSPQGSLLLKWLRVNLKTPVTALLLAFFSFWSLQSSQATTYRWNVDDPGNSSVGSNWSGGISPNGISIAGDTLNLNNALTAPRTVTLDGLVTAGTLNIGATATANAFTLASGTGGYLLMDAIGGPATITKATGANASDTISTNLRFNDTLALTNNSVSGSLTISGGMRSLSSDITFNGTGALTVGVSSGVISTAGNLVKNDAGIATLSAQNLYAGTTTINGGTLKLTGSTAALPARSAVTVAAGATLDYSLSNTVIGSLAGAGDVVNTGSSAGAVLSIGRNDTSTTFSGRIVPTTAANTAITKIGAGTLTLQPTGSNVSTYTGSTTITGGTINLSFANTSLTSLMAATPLRIIGGNFTMTGKAGLAANQQVGGLEVGTAGGAITLVAGDATGTTLRTGTVNASTTGGALLITAPTNTTFQMGTSYTATTLNNRIVFSDGTANTFNWAVNTGPNTTTTGFLPTVSLPSAGGGATNTAYILTGTQRQTTAAATIRSLKLSSTSGDAQTLDLEALNMTLGGTTSASPGAILIDGTAAWNINATGGGTLTQATVTGGDLIFQQYNTTNGVTVNAGISGTLTNLVKAGPGTLVLAGTNTFTGAVVVAGGTLSFNNVNAGGAGSLGNGSTTTGQVSIRDGATLQYTGPTGSISGAAATAGAHNYSLSGGNATIDVATAAVTNVLTLNGVISGPGGLTKTGQGILELGANAVYSGPTFINEGTLRPSGPFSIGNTGNPVTVGANGTLDINGTGAGQSFSIGSLAGSGTVRNNGNTAKLLSVGFDNTSTTFSGTFSGAGANAFNKSGTGVMTLELASPSDWTGAMKIIGGVLRLNNANGLPTTGQVTIGGGTAVAELDLNGNNWTSGAITFYDGTTTATGQGSVAIGTGTLTLGGNITYVPTGSAGVAMQPASISATGDGGILLNADRTITVGNSTSVPETQAELTINAPISGGFGINKAGVGNLLLSRANTYTGLTTVSAGTLQVDTNNALGTNAAGTSVSAGAALKLNGVNYSSTEALSLNGTGISNGGALVNSGTSTFAGQITTATNASISAGGGTLNLTGGLVKNGTIATLMGGGRVNITGTGISGASANSDLVVDGTTVVVSAASDYNGPTYVQNGGAFVANAAITTTALTVNTGSTLSGTGSIENGAGLVNLNGALVVGDSTLGSPVASQFEIGGAGSTLLGNSSSLSFDIFTRGGDLTGTASSADRLKLFGTLDTTLGGTLILGNPSALTGFAAGDKWTLFDLTSGGSITGGLTLDYSGLFSDPLLAGSFDPGTGVFSILGVPEPSRALLLGFGLAGLGLRRRRSRVIA